MKFKELLKQSSEDERKMYLTASFNNDYFTLDEEIAEGIPYEKIKFNDLSDAYTNFMYEKTLCFLLYVAIKELLKDHTLVIEHSISKGLYCELYFDNKIFIPKEKDLSNIKKKIDELIKSDEEIKKIKVSSKEVIEYFKKENLYEKIRLFDSVEEHELILTELLGYKNYFYSHLFDRTSNISIFDLVKYKDGFVLLYPSKSNPEKLPIFEEQEKLYQIFDETGQWNKIIGAEFLGDINFNTNNGNHNRMIAIAEGLHEKKYSKVADKITSKNGVKVVLIAGPSSSGKTTSSKRLAIQLMVNGFKPIALEMDNYFVDREKTPKLPDGSYDFESLRAVNLELFNKDVKDLIEGKEVLVPKFNFKTGIRETGEEKIKLPNDGILIIEGIHALNPELLSNIPSEKKFKIYASALTQLNFDNQNRVSTTDVRRIRRMVRDKARRGYSFEETLKMFKKVIEGEKANIFPYQNEADEMFNTTLIYELGILKKYAVSGLKEIKQDSEVYHAAQRLLTLLNYVNEIDDSLVLNNSVIREFIGGSFFD